MKKGNGKKEERRKKEKGEEQTKNGRMDGGNGVCI
jgi:hypothetical protein